MSGNQLGECLEHYRKLLSRMINISLEPLSALYALMNGTHEHHIEIHPYRISFRRC
jgi:hypothetical protein